MPSCCCCFGRRSSGRRSSGRYQGATEVPNKSKQDDLQSPLSCNSYISEYYDAQESFPVPEAGSPSLSTNVTPRHSLAHEKHIDQAANWQSNGNGVYHSPRQQHVRENGADAAVLVDGSQPPVYGGPSSPRAAAVTVALGHPGPSAADPALPAGTSETSEEPLQAGAGTGPMSRLVGCLSILESIRMPGSASTPTAPGAASSSGGATGTAPPAASAGGADGGNGPRHTSRRLGKMEPGSSLRKRDMSMSVLDVREAWEECDDGTPDAPSTSGRPFMVRGPDYMRTKVKVPNRGTIYRLLAADMITSDTKMTHVARHANLFNLMRPATDPHYPPLLIITIMLPMYPASIFGGNDGPSQSLIFYFGLPPDFNPATYENQTAMGQLRRFIANGREADGSPTRDRFKLIPRVVNVEEWAQKGPLSPAEHKLLATYNDKPILTRPQHYFFTGPGYLEVDIDIHTYQYLARKAFGAYLNRLKEVVWENAFVIQGNSPDELPEQVLASARMYRMDFTRSRPLRDFITPPPAAAGVNGSPLAAAAAVGGLRGAPLSSSRRASLVTSPSAPAPIPEGPEGEPQQQ